MCKQKNAARRAAHAAIGLGLSATPLLCMAEPLEHQVVVDEKGVPQDCLLLNGVPLSAVVAEFNLRNVNQLAIVDPSLEHLGVGGMVCTTRLPSLLRALKVLGVNSVGPIADGSRGGVIRLSRARSIAGLPPAGTPPQVKPRFEQDAPVSPGNQADKP